MVWASKAEVAPQGFAEQRGKLLDTLTAAEQRKQASSDAMATVEAAAAEADRAARAADQAAARRAARAGAGRQRTRQQQADRHHMLALAVHFAVSLCHARRAEPNGSASVPVP